MTFFSSSASGDHVLAMAHVGDLRLTDPKPS